MQLKIEDLSLDQKLGMVLCARRCNNDEDFEYTLELIRNRALGSVQVPLGKRTPEIIKAIKDAADYPILIIADMETGYPLCDLPKVSAMSLAACGSDEYYEAFARGIVKYARADGFNGTWCPVLDIQRVNRPCSVYRHFGDTPEKVSKATEIVSRVFKENGFFSTGKHYPGGCDTPYDSHMTEDISHVTKEELLDFDLVPYIDLMKKGLLPSVMTHHATYDNIDKEYPATLSKKVLDILREQGFDGVYFTDSLAMMGILQKYGEENVYGMCIAAGVDNILTNYRTPTKKCFELLKQNYLDGAFSEERLNDAVRHVLALQEWVGNNEAIEPEFTEHDLELLGNVTRDCITAVTDKGLSAGLGDPNKRRLFVIVTPIGFDGDSTGSLEINDKSWYKPLDIAEKIKLEFPNSEIVYVPEYATAAENERVLVAATRHDEVVFITYCVTGAYLGTDDLTRRTEALINCLNLSGKVSAVAHFGNPYAMEPLDHIKRIIFGYTATESQGYAIEALAGKIPAKGKLPFDVKLK